MKYFLQFVSSCFLDSSPTLLRVAMDSSLNMNQQMYLNGPSEVGHVEADSQPKTASSPLHPTQTTTQTMQTAYTPSLSPLGLSSC